MTVWDFGQREVMEHWLFRDSFLTWIVNDPPGLVSPFVLIYISDFQGLCKGKSDPFCVLWRCIALQRPPQTNIRLMRAGLVQQAAQTRAGGVPFPAGQLLCLSGEGGLECLKCHISPLSSDLKFSQKQASMLLADPLWMQVDLMWHISSSITVGSWVKKAGMGRWLWEEGGPGPDSRPGQLKSLQPPLLWTYFMSPTLTRSPQPSPSSGG